MKALNLFALTSAGLLASVSGGFAAPPAGLTLGPPASVTMGPPAGVSMGPPASVTMGPPASVAMGPPAAALAHIPDGVPLGPPATLPQGPAASAGDSIGATVSASARVHAGDNLGVSTDGGVDSAADLLGNLNAAHASEQGMAHAAAGSIVGEIAAYKSAMTAAMAETGDAQTADITTAREQLALASNKQLTPDAAGKLDSLLGISGADPTLGTTP